MFGPEYFTVGGYETDDGILCRSCGEEKELPIGDSVTVAQLENGFGDDGLSCDRCGEEIVVAWYSDCPGCGERKGRDEYPHKVGPDGRLTSEREELCESCVDDAEEATATEARD